MEAEKKICPLFMISKGDETVCLGERCAWFYKPEPPKYYYVDGNGEQRLVSTTQPETEECVLLKLAKKK